MDEMDRKILRVLQREPELPIVELAERVGLSHTPCWRRIKNLQAAGVIVKRAVILDPKAVGYGVNVFANLNFAKQDEETLIAFEREVEKYPQIVECFSMSGASDYLIRIVAQSIEDYEIFLKKVVLHLPGVSTVNSSFALKAVKLTTDLPL
jgi:Lrp/AsnC family transcriptional regulator